MRKLKKRKKKKWPLIFMKLFMPPWIVGEKDKRSEVDKNTECVSKTQSYLGPVWYVCLKTENCCLKTFVEIRVGEKVC